MTEIQSTQPSAIPSWVMMDHRFRFKEPGSFHADGETSAETQDTNGDPIRVSFDLQAPPRSSSLCLHCPEEREHSWWDFVVASHRDAVLFRIAIDFEGIWVNHKHAMDYFVYRASSSSAKLTLLPRCFSTEAEVDAEVDPFWRRQRRMVHSGSIGLFADGEHFVVVELCLDGDVSTAPLEAKLFRLYSSSSPAANGGGGQWGFTFATSRDGKVTFLDVASWETHRVFPFTSYLCWADYNRGVLFCDVRHKTPDLHYLRLPVDDMPREDFPTFARTVSVCLTDKGDTMKFAKVVNNSNICPTCKHRSGFAISIWTLVINDDDMEWVEDVAITDKELWAMEGYDHGCLPSSLPQFPVVSMDDPQILYFVLRGTPLPTDEVTSWIVTLDMKSKEVLRYDCIKGLSDDNISSGLGFFPSNFTKYLMKHSSNLIDSL